MFRSNYDSQDHHCVKSFIYHEMAVFKMTSDPDMDGLPSHYVYFDGVNAFGISVQSTRRDEVEEMADELVYAIPMGNYMQMCTIAGFFTPIAAGNFDIPDKNSRDAIRELEETLHLHSGWPIDRTVGIVSILDPNNGNSIVRSHFVLMRRSDSEPIDVMPALCNTQDSPKSLLTDMCAVCMMMISEGSPHLKEYLSEKMRGYEIFYDPGT